MGGGDVKDAYENGSSDLRGRLLSRLKTLSQLPLGEWREPHVKNLKGECYGLTEIRFKADGVQQRPLGYQSGPNEFTILFWATEKGNKFIPLSACKKALARKAETESNEELSHDLWFVLE